MCGCVWDGPKGSGEEDLLVVSRALAWYNSFFLSFFQQQRVLYYARPAAHPRRTSADALLTTPQRREGGRGWSAARVALWDVNE